MAGFTSIAPLVQEDPETASNRKRFQTYLNYIENIAALLDALYSNRELLCQSVAKTKTFTSIQGGKCSEPHKVEKLLRNAWFTELQLSIASANHDFIVYSNHWAPVQVYYSAYLLLRAFLIASGQGVRGGHSTTLKAIATQIEHRNELFPAPWGILCDGNPYNKDETNYIGVPKGVVPEKVSALSKQHNVDFLDSYAMFLRTTRKRLIDRRCDDWKRDNHRGRMDSKVKSSYIASLQPTSIFDAMYRLRLRSNYEDADSFLLTLDMDKEALTLNQAMQKLTWYTSFLMELLITKYIGKKNMDLLIKHFVNKDAAKISSKHVASRWSVIKDAW